VRQVQSRRLEAHRVVIVAIAVQVVVVVVEEVSGALTGLPRRRLGAAAGHRRMVVVLMLVLVLVVVVVRGGDRDRDRDKGVFGPLPFLASLATAAMTTTTVTSSTVRRKRDSGVNRKKEGVGHVSLSRTCLP